MAFVPKAGANASYHIRRPSANYTLSVPYTIPTNQWVHVAITQENTTFKFFVDGKLILTDQNASIKPMDLGVTTQNYLGRSQWPNDPYSDQKI